MHSIFIFLLDSHRLAVKTEPFIVSVIGGHDMVPRTTMRSLTYLKMTILDLIGKCHHSKPRVLCCTGCCGWAPSTPTEPHLLNLVPKKANHSVSLHSLDLAVGDKTPALKLMEKSLPIVSRSGVPSSSPGSLKQQSLCILDRSGALEGTDSPQQQHITTHTDPSKSGDSPRDQRIEWDCKGAIGDSPRECRVEWDCDPKVGPTFSIKSRLKKEHHKKKKTCTAQFLKQIDDCRAELKGEREESDGPNENQQPLMFIPGRILHLQEGPQYARKT